MLFRAVLAGGPGASAISGNAFVATAVAGTMTWGPFGLTSSESLAEPAGQVPAGSRFGVSADPDVLLAGCPALQVCSLVVQGPTRTTVLY